MVAIALTTLMLGTAFSVDLGRLRTARRDLQADADFLALDAASVLDGLTVDEALPLVLEEAQASADRNHYAFEPIEERHIELGLWEMNAFTPMSGSQVPNAVRVTLTDAVEMFFDFSTDQRRVTRTAIGVDDFLPDDCLPLPCDDTPQPPDPPDDPEEPWVEPEPRLRAPASRAELGSVLARLDTYQQPSVDPSFNAAVEAQATFMNHIFSQFLGINRPGGVNFGAGATADATPVTGPATGLRLDALSWKGLADSQISVDALAEQLRVDGVLSAGTVDELLTSTISVADFLDAAARVLDPSGTSIAAGTILGDIATSMDQTLQMQFGRYMQASTGRGGVLETVMNVDDLLMATISIIDGRNVVNAEIPLKIPGLPAGLVEVAPTTLAKVTVVEPPTTHRGYRVAGQPGPSTAQIRIELNIPVTALRLDLSLLSALLGTQVRTGNVPLVIEVAKARSVYEDMACRTASSTSWTDLAVENSGVSVRLDPSSAGLVETSGLLGLASRSMVHGSVSIGGLIPLNVNLDSTTNVNHAETWSRGVHHPGGLTSNLTVLENFETRRHVPPYISQWLQYPSVPAQLAPLQQTFTRTPFGSSGLSAALHALLVGSIRDAYQPLMDRIDAAIVDPLVQSMGVTLAGSDARIHKLRCRGVHVV